MDRASPPCFASLLRRLPRAALGLCLAGLLAPGCAQPAAHLTDSGSVLAAASPRPAAVAVGGERVGPPPAAAAPADVVPISLEAIFRLAEDQNARVQIARQRVSAACADLAVAEKAWLPQVWVGTAYYRHEGGIQDETGILVHSSSGALFGGVEGNAQVDLREATFQRIKAEREVWQQRGQLSQITYDTLLDAATTYLDLLTVRTGEAIARDLEIRLRELLNQAEGLGNTIAQAPVETVRAQVQAQKQALLHLQQL